MAITVNTPDGGTASFPDGTPQEVMQGALRAKFGGPSAEDVAHSQGMDAGERESALSAFAGQGAQQATFGLNNYVRAGARYAAQRIAGNPSPDTFSEDLSRARGQSEGEIGAHSVAGTIGGVLGGLGVGGAISKGLSVAKKIPGIAGLVEAALPKAGEGVKNVAKAAATGAAITGGTSEAEGKDHLTSARDAAFGAVVGPIVGKLATGAISWAEPYVSSVIGKLVPSFNPGGLAPASKAAMKTLSDNLGVTPTELQQAYDAHLKLTGSLPSIAQLTTLKAQGKLKALAAANPEIGEAAITAAQAGGAPLHEQLAQAAQDRAALANMPAAAVGATTLRQTLGPSNTGATQLQIPQTSQSLLSARDSAMTNLMDTPSAAGLKLRDEPVSNHTGIFSDPHIEIALRDETRHFGQLNAPNPVLDKIQQGAPLTLNDVEVVRKALRDQQAAWSAPSRNTDRAASPTIASEFGNIAQKVEGEASAQYPDYGKALRGFRQTSRYETGFQHGLSGKGINEAADNFTAKDLATTMGQAGYAHGNALSRAQQALDAISPGRVPEAQIPTAETAVKGAKAVVLPTVSSVASIANHLKGLSLPDNVQKVVAKQLFSNDPVVVRQGIANLSRAKVSADNIRQLGAAIGGSADIAAAQYLNGK